VSNRDEQKDLAILAKAFFDHLGIIECEYGGIGLDCKRPFGNSDATADILELIGWEPEGDDGEDACFASWQRDYASGLYHEKLIPFMQAKWATLP
jgi:hypothetical protein